MRVGWAALLAAGALLAGGTKASGALVPFYAGGSLSEAAVSGSAYAPTVGVTLVPRPDGRVALAFDTTLRCGRAVTQVRVARTVAWDGATVQAQGRGRAAFAGRGVRFTWVVQARADGQAASGTVQIAARRHGRRCRGRAPRGFLAPLMPAAPGASARPAAASAYSGGGPRLVAGRRPGSVVLRVSPDGSRVAARWAVAARCSRGRPHRLVNLTPPTRIAADGTFARRERFAVRYADAFVHYRVRFSGRFTGTTAGGSLRLRATVLTRRGGAVVARCDTRRRGWSARASGEAPGQPAPAAPPPAPGAGTTAPPPPDPTFRPDPVVGTWSFDMDSDPGEYIGQGEMWHHGSAYGEPLYLDVFTAGNIIQFMTQTRDGEDWTASWSTQDGSALHTGTYATGAGTNASQGYGGHGRGCGTFTGSFTIDALAYDPNGALRTFDVRFEAHCEGLAEALRGAFHFRAA